MGAYCHSHGFCPVGPNHNSKTCAYKLDAHKDNATWTNRLGGNMNWPIAIMSPLNNKMTQNEKERLPPPTDMDQGS
jgi:hypothetical protein